MVPHPRLLDDAPREDRSGHAREAPFVAHPGLSAGLLDGHACRDPAPRRAAVDLAVREDADVCAGPVIAQPAVGQDGPVQERQVRVPGVVELELRLGRAGHRPGRVDQRPGRRLAHVKAEARRRREGVEGTAVADVHLDGADTRHLDLGAEERREGSHTLEVHQTRTDPPHPHVRGDEAARTLHAHGRARLAGGHQTLVHRPPRHRDRGVPAHRGVALVVAEEHREIGVGVVRLHRNHAVHVVVAPRLMHQEATQVIEVLARVPPLVEDRRTRNVRVAGGHDPDGLAAGVHLAGADFGRESRHHSPDRRSPNHAKYATAADSRPHADGTIHPPPSHSDLATR